MTHFRLASSTAALLVALLVATMITFAFGRPPPRAVIASDQPSLDDTLRDVGIAALKSASAEPRLIQTETVIPMPSKVPPLVVLSEPPPRKIEAKHAAENNICTKHAMQKIWVSKYKWRCRK